MTLGYRLIACKIIGFTVLVFLSSVTFAKTPLPEKQKCSSGIYNKVDAWEVAADYAWVLTGERVFITNNAGEHWREPKLPAGPARALDFLDAQNGWAASYRDEITLISRTYDGGYTWSVISELPRAASWPQQLTLVDYQFGWMRASGAVWRTDDGGITWKEVLPFGATLRSLAFGSFIGPLKAWVASEGGELRSTKDGGQTWLVHSIADSGFEDLLFIDEYSGWLRLPVNDSFDGESFQTTDGGSTWQKQQKPEVGTLWGTSFVDTKMGWAVGQRSDTSDFALMKTADSGQTWEIITSVDQEIMLWGVKLVDSERGWIIGNDYLYYTSDGGKNLKRVLKLSGRCFHCLLPVHERL
jgi:photosystem II stability/assembly factor-like uncharacterized protein